MSKAFELTMMDYSAEVLAALQDQVQKGLKAIGEEAEGYAKEDCPVDTGRLRNSITFAITDYQSEANTNKHHDGTQDADVKEYKTKANPEANTLYVGTNVSYAAPVEYRDLVAHKVGKAHFMKNSIANHGEHYKEIMKAALNT